MPKARPGFTLIELLIVVVIMGILASIAIPKFANTKTKTYIASMKEDLRNLASVQEAYFAANNGHYASSVAALGTSLHTSPGVTIILGVTGSGWRATATHWSSAVRCKLAAGTTRAYDGAVICQ